VATNNSGGSQGRESRPKTNNYGKDGKSFSGENPSWLFGRSLTCPLLAITS